MSLKCERSCPGRAGASETVNPQTLNPNQVSPTEFSGEIRDVLLPINAHLTQMVDENRPEYPPPPNNLVLNNLVFNNLALNVSALDNLAPLL